MRPKKNLVILGADVLWASRLRFVMETRLYIHCVVTDEFEAAIELAQLNKCDGMLVLGDVWDEETITSFVPGCPVMRLQRLAGDQFQILTPDESKHLGDTPTLLLLVRTMLAHKRGPKPKTEILGEQEEKP